MKKLINLVILFSFALALNRAQAQEIKKWKLADLKAAIKNADKPTIFTFWATYCVPCVGEIPNFQKLAKDYQASGVKLILVSLDLSQSYPDHIKAFAAKRGLTAPIVFLDETNADEFCPVVDEQWSGAIPASLFINNKTGYHHFFE